MVNSTKPEKPVGHIVNLQNQDDTSWALQLIEAILEDAVNQLTYRRADAQADMRTIKNRVKHEGLPFITQTLPRFINEFFILIENGKPSFEGFKKKPSSQLPVFLYGLTSMVLSSVEQDYKAFDFLYSLCVSFKKLKGPYPESVLSDNLDKFIATDNELLSVDITSKINGRLVQRARHFINRLFEKIDIGDMSPKPGSGATNTPLNYSERFQPFTVYEQLSDKFPYPLWFYTNAMDFKSDVGKYFALARAKYPKSRLKFIHKYVGKPRGICIEENETQWCQQAVKGLMYRHIERHPMTKGHINFADQKINQQLALSSSGDQTMSTIDMSEASDRIWRCLVFALYRDTKLLPYLDAVSTRLISFPEEVRAGEMLVQKFAPMGSAVCFPVMATVHWALVKAIIQLCMPGDTRKLSQHVYVYGDDIIVPTETVKYIFEYLPRFGMKLNKEKSFANSYFRESCGMHAYKGHDVTPVYNNYTLTNKSKLDSTCLLSSIAKEALYFEKGFNATAAVIRRRIRDVYGPIPFGGPTSKLLCFKRNSFTDRCITHYGYPRVRYNADLQTYEMRVRCVVPRKAENTHTLSDKHARLRWFLTRSEESGEFRDFDELKLVHQWLTESDLG
jgi:hypothetical protein